MTPTSGRGRWSYLADASDIIQWSDRIDSRSELPRLVRRLIYVTNDQVAQLEMRGAEGVGAPGYDGFVEASKATPFVPAGKSVWELGTGEKPWNKANSDYRKRTADPLDTSPSETTFVFVTSRRWAAKDTWAAKKRAEGRWHDVRVLDVDNIEQALEAAPGVHFWFSEMVGKPASGVQTIEEWWATFSSRPSPSLTPGMVLTGRQDAAAELLRLLQEDRKYTTVASKSIDDVLAFVAATIMSSSQETREALLSRTLIVREAAVLRLLDAAPALLILLPFEESMRREAELVRFHHVIFLSIDGAPVDIDLPPLDQLKFESELVKFGVSEEEARKLGRAAHKSLVAYQRQAASSAVPPSAWAAQLKSRVVRRAWLAGGWNARRSGDTEVLSALLGRDYADIEHELNEVAQAADPILTSVGGTWTVVSMKDTWPYCLSHVSLADLQALETAVQTVLAAVDPALELPAKDRWMAAIHGKSRIHSSLLRIGLATTLCFFGARGDELSLGNGETTRTWALSVVHSLFERANADESGHLWSSLSDVLPLLAEAAPDVVLQALQVGLTGSPPILTTMFVDDDDAGFTVSSPHTGLLWALETVAWSPNYFSLAVERLAALAEVDPGGRLSNRPAGSLVDIFRPWLPQTAATPASRLAALDAIESRHPQVAWRLWLGLLPERSAVGMYTHAPLFQDWKPQKVSVTMSEYGEFVSAVGQRLLKTASDDPGRWVELATRLADLPPDVRDLAFDALAILQVESLSPDDQTKLWNEFNELVRSHRAFADADWALPPAVLDELSKISDRFEPTDSIRRHAWLFESHMPELGVKKHGDYAAYQDELAALRGKAAAEIERDHGLAGLLTLASVTEVPGFLGVAVAAGSTTVNPDDVVNLLDSQDGHEVAFATGFVRRASGGAMSWLEPRAEVRQGRPLLQARLLLCSDELELAWEAAEGLGPDVDHAYWKEFNGFGRGSDFGLVNEVARHMIDHGRAAAALDFVNVYLDHDAIQIDAQFVVEAFEALMGSSDPEIGLLSSYDISHLLEFLRTSTIDEDQLAVLEWRLLPASDAGVGPTSPILSRKLSRDPAFFVEIVSLCYKPHGSDRDSEIAPHVAQNAYRLLEHWNQPPGSDEPGGVIDGKRLDAWVDEARRLLGEADRAEIGEHLIGNILAHSPQDEDGAWPPRAVRDLIEKSASAKLESGVRIERHNMRGVTSRGLDDGGAQERALAKTYGDWADSVKDTWPRTAAMLRLLADNYIAEGRMYDEEAERFREGIER